MKEEFFDISTTKSFHDYLEQLYPRMMGTCYDVSISKGWWQIVLDMAQRLEQLAQDGTSVRIVQIKEKFGLLRVYLDVDNENYDDAYAIVKEAEQKSATTCEFCGSIENVARDCHTFYWIRTLCASCDANRKRKDREL